MSKILLIAALLAVALCNIHLNIKYRDFLHGEGTFSELIAKKIYNDFHSPFYAKSDFRFKIFLENLIEVRNHNVGKHSWVQGINDFADMTFEEFTEERLMAPQDCSATNSFEVKEEAKPVSIPDSYEWNSFGVVTPVKNQGNCGSCWTFSTIGAMQSHWNILQKGKDLIFSEQQLVDCAGNFDNHGCNGGLPSHAFQYIKYAGGLEGSATYPYKAKDQKCAFNKSATVAYVKYGSFNITKGDQVQLAERLYSVGPQSVSFQVINGFSKYVSGVYKVNNCGKTTKDVNHAVLATGYGEEGGVKFWNVKNSWGASWGIKGYFKIQREANMCAIAQCNAYPLIDKPSLEGLQAI